MFDVNLVDFCLLHRCFESRVLYIGSLYMYIYDILHLLELGTLM